MKEDSVAGRGRPEAEEDGAAPQNRRRRPKGQMNLDVPPVWSVTGEKVMESVRGHLCNKWPDKLKFISIRPDYRSIDYSICEPNALWRSRYTENVTLPTTMGGSDMDGAGAQQSELIYIEQGKAVNDYELTTLYVDFGHLLERGNVLPRAINDQYYWHAFSFLNPKYILMYPLGSLPISDVPSSTSSENTILPISTSTPRRLPLQTPDSKPENLTSLSIISHLFLVLVSFAQSALELSSPLWHRHSHLRSPTRTDLRNLSLRGMRG